MSAPGLDEHNVSSLGISELSENFLKCQEENTDNISMRTLQDYIDMKDALWRCLPTQDERSFLEYFRALQNCYKQIDRLERNEDEELFLD
jgi:hypothetical protein